MNHPLFSFLLTFGVESLSYLALANDSVWNWNEGEEEDENNPVIPHLIYQDQNVDYDTNVHVFDILTQTFPDSDYKNNVEFSEVLLGQPFLALPVNNSPLIVLSLNGIESHIFYCQEKRPFLYERVMNYDLSQKFGFPDENWHYLFYETSEEVDHGGISMNIMFNNELITGSSFVIARILSEIVETAIDNTTSLLKTSYHPGIEMTLDKLRKMSLFLQKYFPQTKSARGY